MLRQWEDGGTKKLQQMLELRLMKNPQL